MPALVALTLAPGAPVRAQAGTADLLQRARALYERLEIERALPLLRQVVSPAWPLEITNAQRVEAYTYLGAALALAGKRDSAVLFFRAALERDAFTDLDAARFTPAQLAAFAAARRRTFAVGIRPVTAGRVDPRIQRVAFTVVSTHPAGLRAVVRSRDGADSATLFDGANDGAREILWDGLVRGGRVAPPGRYEVLVTGRSGLGSNADSARTYLDVRHEVEPLEDSLPPLGPADLLPEHYPESAAGRDLLKALGVALSALIISDILAHDDLGVGPEGRVVAGIAAGSGLAAFAYRRRHRERRANIVANEPRRVAWRAANEEIRRRNADRIAATVLVVEPAAGVGPPP